MITCRDSTTEIIKLLLSCERINPTIISEFDSVLSAAYSRTDNNKEVIEILLKHPALDINMTAPDGNTLLHYAAEKNDVDMIDFLFKQSAIQEANNKKNLDMNLLNNYYATPLDKNLIKYFLYYMGFDIKWENLKQQKEVYKILRNNGGKHGWMFFIEHCIISSLIIVLAVSYLCPDE